MGDLTKNISQSELDCKCGNCSVTILPYEPVIQHWQDCCDFFAKKNNVEKVTLIITSAARCYDYNRSVGSSDNSRHPRCNAIDGQIFVNGEQIDPELVFNYFDNRFKYSCGVGLYKTFTHFDNRPVRARW